MSGKSLVKPLAFPFQPSMFARLSCSIWPTVRRFKSLGVTTYSWIREAREARLARGPARTGTAASVRRYRPTEEAIVFAMLAETLRGTLPK